MRTLPKILWYKGPYDGISKKDLKNVCHHINTLSKVKRGADAEAGRVKSAREKLQALVLRYRDEKKAISYKYHLGGVAHRKGVGPGRSPAKIYAYLYRCLKNMRGHEEVLKRCDLVACRIQTSSNKRRGGYRIGGRGSMVPEDRRVHRVVFGFLQSSR